MFIHTNKIYHFYVCMLNIQLHPEDSKLSLVKKVNWSLEKEARKRWTRPVSVEKSTSQHL